MRKTTFIVLLAAFAGILQADFTYQQTGQMTGGALFNMLKLGGPFTRQAREPIISTVIVKGNRMAQVSKERTQVIDLDKETITEIDNGKKQYSVVTFAQMKQAMDDAIARAKSEQAQKGKDGKAPNVEADFKVDAKATDKSKNINGLNAKELIFTMKMEATDKDSGQTGSMVIVNDTWLASVDGYDEVKAFHRKMGEKMGYLFGSGMAQLGMAKPETLKGFAEVSRVMATMDGVPVESVMKMGGEGTGTDACAQTQAQTKAESPNVGAAAAGAALGRLSGLGGFGGLGRKNKEPQSQKQGSAAEPAADACGTLIEMATSMNSFSDAPADMSKFDVPAGYKQIESDMTKRGSR